MQTRSALFQIWDGDGRVRLMQTNGYFSDAMMHQYVDEEFCRADIWADIFFHPDRIDKGPFRASEVLPTEDFKSTELYNEFFRRHGDDTAQCLGGGFTLGDSHILGISVHRAYGDAEFEVLRVAQARQFANHFARMMRIRKKIVGYEERTSLLEACIDNFNGVFVMLDSQGKIEFMNGGASELAANADFIRIAGGRLSLKDTLADNRMQATISSRHRVGGMGDAFVCFDDHGVAWRVHVTPCQRGGVSGCFVIIETGDVTIDNARRLQLIYGLSPAETRVALGIADGQSATELADMLQVSPATVRTHLRHVFEKTQISKATQLSRMIASLPPLPPDPWREPDRVA